MRTLTINYKTYKATYRGKLVFDCRCEGWMRNIGDLEDLAREEGFTHIQWLHLPIGNGKQKTKL